MERLRAAEQRGLLELEQTRGYFTATDLLRVLHSGIAGRPAMRRNDRLHLLAERTTLQEMIDETPSDDVLDLSSLRARLAGVDQQLATGGATHPTFITAKTQFSMMELETCDCCGYELENGNTESYLCDNCLSECSTRVTAGACCAFRLEYKNVEDYIATSTEENCNENMAGFMCDNCLSEYREKQKQVQE
jgi:hypothetical protein